MGLMDFLGLDTRDIQEFTRGFVGSKVEAMEAEANRKAGLKNEEDKLKLQKLQQKLNGEKKI